MTNQENKKYAIGERALDFAATVGKFANKIPFNQVTKEYLKQLIRSSASIGANIEEADGTLSKKDFVNKMAIGRREARESRYWLQLIKRTGLISKPENEQELAWMTREAEEIMLILSSIINKVMEKSKYQNPNFK